MPKYTPLPIVQLDPRNEEGLLRAASTQVYLASGGTLNDFSSGSPIRALLEGQVFAQGEFLNWVNQLPEAILMEWIGPYLGAMRSLGSPSQVILTFRVTPRNTSYFIPQGRVFSTKVDDEDSLDFVLTEDVRIPPGSSIGQGKAECVVIGSIGNVSSGTITKIKETLRGLVSVFNSEAATGGTDIESLGDVKERFFRQIRRRIPVSIDDWKDLVEDVLGSDVICNVVFNRSNRYYHRSTLEDNHHLSLFALNSDGSELTSIQKKLLRDAVDVSSPIGISVNIYPLDVEYVDVSVGMTYREAGKTARELSSSVREVISDSLSPTGQFPTDYAPRVNDLESSVLDRLEFSTGSSKYTGPEVERFSCYINPPGIPGEDFSLSFDTAYRVNQGDLVVANILGQKTYYASQTNFNPVTFSKPYHINTGDLVIKPVLSVGSKVYEPGDIISYNGELYYATSGFLNSNDTTLDSSSVMGPLNIRSWSPATLYNPFSTGSFLPIVFTISSGEIGDWIEPGQIGSEDLEKRPGWYVALAAQSFTSVRTTSDISIARSLLLVSDTLIDVMTLEPGVYYNVGSYVRPTQGLYLTHLGGYLEPVFKVSSGFKLELGDSPDYRKEFQSLIDSGSLVQVREVEFENENGNSFEDRVFSYNARFKCGEYLRYRPVGGPLNTREDCLDQLNDECRSIVSAQYQPPQYFLALRDFTPWTQSVLEMVENGDILAVEYPYEYTATVQELTPEYGQCQYVCPLPEGAPAETLGFRDIFHLSPGDVASVYNDGEVVNYLVKSHLTPVFPPETYINSGLMESVNMESNRGFYSDGGVEDVMKTREGYYRAIRSFTPTSLVTARNLEVNRKVLRVVVELTGSDRIITNGDRYTSVTSPSVTRVSIQDGNTLDYQWEGEFLTYETGVSDEQRPVDYQRGTLAL